MSKHELEGLYQTPSYFDQQVLDEACSWGDEIRPGLKKLDGTITDPGLREVEVSPLDKLESRIEKFGITSAQSLAELAFIGMKLSREKESQGGK